MQFYVLNPDPEKNVTLLPDYALKVNVREGWQILSDIGHIYGVTWPSQNKCYSTSHPTTRWHCRNLQAYKDFLRHYMYCLIEQTKRTGKHSSFREKLNFSVDYFSPLSRTIPDIPDYLSDTAYILREKQDKMTEKEYKEIKKYYAIECNKYNKERENKGVKK